MSDCNKDGWVFRGRGGLLGAVALGVLALAQFPHAAFANNGGMAANGATVTSIGASSSNLETTSTNTRSRSSGSGAVFTRTANTSPMATAPLTLSAAEPAGAAATATIVAAGASGASAASMDVYGVQQGMSAAESLAAMQAGNSAFTTPPSTPGASAGAGAGAGAGAPAAPAASMRINPTGRTIEIGVPLREGQFVLGELPLQITAQDELGVPAARLAEILSRRITSEEAQKIIAAARADGRVTQTGLAALGYALSYDPGRIDLSIIIPVSARPRRGFGLSDFERRRIGEVETPARFAAFANIRGALDYVYSGGEKGFSDPFFNIDLGGRIGAIAWQSEHAYSGSDSRWTRSGTRAIYDQLGPALRWTLGDLRPQSSGGFGAGDLLGIGVERAFETLQPERLFRPRGGRSFNLTETSDVQIQINGQTVNRQRLEPGTYDVRDFPFVFGQNQVTFLIENPTGQKETFTYDVFLDRGLLETGIDEFSFSAGVLATQGARGRTYNSDRWLATGFYRRGLSDALTLGISARVEEDSQIASLETVFGSRLGVLSGTFGLSNADGVGSDYQARVSFARQIPTRQNDFRSSGFGFSIEARGPNFARGPTNGGVALSDQGYSVDLAANYYRQLTRRFGGGIDIGQSIGRGITPDRSFVALRGSFALGLAWSLDGTIDWRSDGIGAGDDVGFQINISRRFGLRTNVRSGYDSRTEQLRLNYNRSAEPELGAISYSADATRGPDGGSASGTASAFFNRGDASIAHFASMDGDGSITGQRSSARFGTAIAFADGKFAIGRPVGSSFAIIAAHPTLQGRRVEIDSRGAARKPTTASGTFGPALVGDLGAYAVRSVTVSVPDLPPGYDIGAGSYRVAPPFQAGYVFTVGSEFSVTVIGELLDEEGNLVALESGQARSVDDPTRAPIIIFTNRAGRFGLSGLKPGKWQIVMTNGGAIYDLSIAPGTDNLRRVGALRPRG